MGLRLKPFIIRVYHFIRYRKARQLSGKKIPFDHYRELSKKWLKDSAVKTILDVGANKGQFAKLAREVFPGAKIYSFEPLPDCFEILQNALPGDNNFFSMNKAVGSHMSTLQFFRSVHSPSSSFLKMEELHKEAFPESSQGQDAIPIDVEVISLDSFFESVKPENEILLKIDVQGFEGEVIKGATLMLKNVKIVIVEVSHIQLYKEQPMFHDIYMLLNKQGFRFHGNLAQMYHPGTNEVVQADAIFINES